MKGAKYFIWSNIQPNLYVDMGDAGEDMSRFHLTSKKYYEMKQLVEDVLGGTCIFVSRQEDIDEGLVGLPNVWTFELERSIDSRGPEDLYAPIFEEILARHV